MAKNLSIAIDWKLAYAPQNPILDQMLQQVTTALKLDGFDSFNSAENLQSNLTSHMYLAGILFHDMTVGSTIFAY